MIGSVTKTFKMLSSEDDEEEEKEEEKRVGFKRPKLEVRKKKKATMIESDEGEAAAAAAAPEEKQTPKKKKMNLRDLPLRQLELTRFLVSGLEPKDAERIDADSSKSGEEEDEGEMTTTPPYQRQLMRQLNTKEGIVDNLVSTRPTKKLKNKFWLVANRDVPVPETTLFRLDEGIDTDGNPLARGNANMHVFCHRFKEEERTIIPKPIGEFLTRAYGGGSSNAEFKVYEDRVEVVSSKPILEGEPIKVFAGANMLDRWINGTWGDPFVDEGPVDQEELTDENASLRPNPLSDVFDLVAASNLQTGQRIYRYERKIFTDPEAVSSMWNFVFHMDYFYHVFEGNPRIADPKPISVHLNKEFALSKSNARYVVYRDKIDIVATRPIREGRQIHVYSGPGVNFRWVGDGEWEYYYRSRTRNLYTFRSPQDVHYRHEAIKAGCGDSMCYKHCDCAKYDAVCKTDLCSCDPELCQNRPFEKPFPETFIKTSDVEGTGLFAGQDIPLGAWIIEYIGEVVNTTEYEHRSQYYAKDNSNFVATSNYNFIIDPSRSGNIARFANHSCDPNATTEDVIDNQGITRIVLKAKKRISEGEEIFWDYDEIVDAERELIACRCNTSKCRRTMNRILKGKEKRDRDARFLEIDKERRAILDRDRATNIRMYRQNAELQGLVQAPPIDDRSKNVAGKFMMEFPDLIEEYSTAMAGTRVPPTSVVEPSRVIGIDIDVEGTHFEEETKPPIREDVLAKKEGERKEKRRKQQSPKKAKFRGDEAEAKRTSRAPSETKRKEAATMRGLAPSETKRLREQPSPEDQLPVLRSPAKRKKGQAQKSLREEQPPPQRRAELLETLGLIPVTSQDCPVQSTTEVVNLRVLAPSSQSIPPASKPKSASETGCQEATESSAQVETSASGATTPSSTRTASSSTSISLSSEGPWRVLTSLVPYKSTQIGPVRRIAPTLLSPSKVKPNPHFVSQQKVANREVVSIEDIISNVENAEKMKKKKKEKADSQKRAKTSSGSLQSTSSRPLVSQRAEVLSPTSIQATVATEAVVSQPTLPVEGSVDYMRLLNDLLEEIPREVDLEQLAKELTEGKLPDNLQSIDTFPEIPTENRLEEEELLAADRRSRVAGRRRLSPSAQYLKALSRARSRSPEPKRGPELLQVEKEASLEAPTSSYENSLLGEPLDDTTLDSATAEELLVDIAAPVARQGPELVLPNRKLPSDEELTNPSPKTDVIVKKTPKKAARAEPPYVSGKRERENNKKVAPEPSNQDIIHQINVLLGETSEASSSSPPPVLTREEPGMSVTPEAVVTRRPSASTEASQVSTRERASSQPPEQLEHPPEGVPQSTVVSRHPLELIVIPTQIQALQRADRDRDESAVKKHAPTNKPYTKTNSARKKTDEETLREYRTSAPPMEEAPQAVTTALEQPAGETRDDRDESATNKPSNYSARKKTNDEETLGYVAPVLIGSRPMTPPPQATSINFGSLVPPISRVSQPVSRDGPPSASAGDQSGTSVTPPTGISGPAIGAANASAPIDIAQKLPTLQAPIQPIAPQQQTFVNLRSLAPLLGQQPGRGSPPESGGVTPPGTQNRATTQNGISGATDSKAANVAPTTQLGPINRPSSVIPQSTPSLVPQHETEEVYIEDYDDEAEEDCYYDNYKLSGEYDDDEDEELEDNTSTQDQSGAQDSGGGQVEEDQTLGPSRNDSPPPGNGYPIPGRGPPGFTPEPYRGEGPPNRGSDGGPPPYGEPAQLQYPPKYAMYHHTAAMMGHIMHPYEPPSSAVHSAVRGAVVNSGRDPGASDMQHFAQVASTMSTLGDSSKKDADAYRVISDVQNNTMKIHLDGEMATMRVDLDREKAQSEAELGREKLNLEHLKMRVDHSLADQRFQRDRMEHDKHMYQLDLQVKTLEAKQAAQRQQAERSRLENNLKLLELDQTRERIASGKKYTFLFTRQGGTRLVPSNEPCDPEDRRKFDNIWATSDSLLGGAWEDHARKMTSLNVVTNPIDFKRYIDKLTKKTQWRSDESILKRRMATLEALNKDSGVYLFQTGPAASYSFYVWDGQQQPAAGSSLELMYGNPRYVVHRARGGALYTSDLWEPILYSQTFPVDMPYTSQNFAMDQGIDSRGAVYNGVSTPARGTAPVYMSVPVMDLGRAPGLEVNDIKTVWFELPRANESSFKKYYQLDDAMRRASYPEGAMMALSTADGTDPISVFVAVAGLVRYHRGSMEVDLQATNWAVATAGDIILDITEGSAFDYSAAEAVYDTVFPDYIIPPEQMARIETVLLRHPAARQEREQAAAVAEIDTMRVMFQGNDAAIETAVNVYGMQLSRYIFEEYPMNAVAEMLAVVNRINVPFDTTALPVLAKKMEKITTHAFRYMGLKVEVDGDTLLRRMANFQNVFKRRIAAIYPALKDLLSTHRYVRYLTALHHQMGLEGVDFQRAQEEMLPLLEDTYTDPLAPASYSVQTALENIENDDQAVMSVQSIMFQEILVTLADIDGKLEAGEIVDPVVLVRIRTLQDSILNLEKNKRDALLNKLSVLRRLSRSRAVNELILRTSGRKEFVLEEIRSVSLRLNDISERRKCLIDNLLGKQIPPSMAAVNPPRMPDYIPCRSYYPQPLSKDYRPVYFPTTEPSQQLFRGRHMRAPDRPPPGYWDQCAEDSRMITKAMTGPPIQYRPIGETWRTNAIGSIFGMDPASHPRSNYAIGFSPMLINQPEQIRIKQPVIGDGNCFYRTLSKAIFGSESNRLQYVIRQKIGAEVQRQKAQLDTLLKDSLGSGKRILIDRQWADEYVLMVTSVILGVRIYIHMKEDNSTGWGMPPVLNYSRPHPLTNAPWPDEAIYIDHVGRTHYNPVHIGIKVPSDAIITQSKVRHPRVKDLPVPSLTAGKTLYMDGGLARRILTAALVDKTLDYINLRNTKEHNRMISAARMPSFKQPFITYFNNYNDPAADFRTLTFSRVKSSSTPQWAAATVNSINTNSGVEMVMRDVVNNTDRIQDDLRPGVLMVDFANKSIGGGTLGHGAVQEELLFLTYPELILSMLFMPDAMRTDEAVVMTGAVRMSDYTYAPDRSIIPQQLPNTVPIRGDFVAIDAIYFGKNPETQYNKRAIDRELTKAYAGFNQEGYTHIRTGNWGSGAFGGDNRLKLIIQLLACTVANKKMIYCCFEQADDTRLRPVLRYCDGQTVAAVYKEISAITSKGDLDKILRNK